MFEDKIYTSRTELLAGRGGVDELKKSCAAVFGLGGVGGYALEALVRAGIGKIIIVDFDVIVESNFNRQILALKSDLNNTKTGAAIKRIEDINPDAEVIAINKRITPENVSSIVTEDIDWAVDAIDEIDPKVHLIMELCKKKIDFISSMGAGRKLNPEWIKISDISKTSHCALARKIRKKLKTKGITEGVKCIYSEEKRDDVKKSDYNEKSIGSISYIPGIFGLYAAGYIIKNILEKQ